MSHHDEIRRAQDLRLRKERLLLELKAQNEELAELRDGVDLNGAEITEEQSESLATFFNATVEAEESRPSEPPTSSLFFLALASRA